MSKFVADTMAFVLWLEKRKMPVKAKAKFQSAEKAEVEILVPALVFAEIAYLSENNRIDTNLEEAKRALAKNKNIKEYPMTFETVRNAFEIDDIPELHDRLVAGAAKELNAEIISNDPEIEQSVHVHTIWK